MKKHIESICREYENAIRKHPFFANTITHNTAAGWNYKERVYKERNEMNESSGNKNWAADEILAEEVAEAMHAAAAGEIEHAQQEFYQVAAVCLRCVDLLEMKKNGCVRNT